MSVQMEIMTTGGDVLPDSGPDASATSLVLPPPDIKSIVDKTAFFVARNGLPFEERIRAKEYRNPKFCFLQPNDAYHPYYQFRIAEIQAGRESEPSKDGAAAADAAGQATDADATAEAKSAPPNEPPSFEYSADLPTLSAQDLDIVKLTAQFVARNGRQFLSALAQREQRNFQFDFLRPTHSLFPYFNQLVEQYSKILMPTSEHLTRLATNAQSKHQLLKRVMDRVSYAAYMEAERKKAEDQAEQERVAFLSIDWHDFVVVGTIEFTEDDEQTNLPAPLSLRELESMTLEQKRHTTVTSTFKEQQAAQDDGMDIEEDMVESDNEEPVAKAPQQRPDMSAHMKIRKDYVPKARTGTSGPKTQEPTQICPRCNQAIPVSEMEEHVRIELLDPRWKEQRQAAEAKSRNSNLLREGTEVDKLLKNISGYRSDIFGSDEAGIGARTTQEQERLKEAEKQKVIWDGHSGTIPATRDRAAVGMSMEEQMAAIQRSKEQAEEANRIGPQATGHAPPPGMPTMPPMPQQLPGMPPTSAIPGMPAPPPPPMMPPGGIPYGFPGMMPYGAQAHGAPFSPPPPPHQHQHQHPGMMPPHGPPPHGHGMPPPPADYAANHVQQPGAGEGNLPGGRPADDAVDGVPDAKKMRMEGQFIPAEEWMAMHPEPITLTLQAVNMPDRSDGKLNGQSVPLAGLALSMSVAELRDRIAEAFGVPANRQKLTSPAGSAAGPNGALMKPQFTLAYYNLKDGDAITVGMVVRGGRR